MTRFRKTLQVGQCVSVFALLAACVKPEKNQGADTAQDTTGASTTQATTTIDPGDVYDETWSTQLPAGVVADAESFRARLAAMNAFSGTRYERVRAGKLCNCDVSVAIEAVSPTRPLDPGRPPNPPRVVAHLENLDAQHTEAYYGLKKKSSNMDYYFWIDSQGGKSRFTVLEVPRGSGRVKAGKQHLLSVCHPYKHGADSTDYGEADFVEYRPQSYCARNVASKTRGLSFSSLPMFAKVTALFHGSVSRPASFAVRSDGGWIDCNSGCCW
jgi:hypothetical protein